MGKYLIEDIIPPGKKHRVPVAAHRSEHAAPERVTHTETPHPSRVAHHSPATKIARVSTPPEDLHPHTRRVTEHRTTLKKHPHAPYVGDVPAVVERPLVVENPKMILRQEIDDEPDEEEVQTPSSSYFNETPTMKTGDGAWPYNAGNEKPPYIPPSRYGSSEKSFFGVWLPWILIPAIVGIVVVIGFNVFFSGATITLLPKHDNIPMDNQLVAEKNPASGGLSFSVMKVVLEDTREVPATGEKTVTAKASGRVIVYNKQTNTQRLIKNTRFQSSKGKIYRIADSIDVPKAKTVGGKVTPGSLEVTVYADEAGPDYNADPTDFTLPGLKGSPTFDKVYGRSKNALSGGASGVIKSVSDQDLKQAGEDLRVQLETKLRSKARADLSPSQISFDTGIIAELGEPVLSKAAASSADKAVVSESGTLYMVTFDRKELTDGIVRALVPTYGGENVSMSNLESLQFSITPTKGGDLWAAEKLDFSLKGTADITWIVDQDAVKKVLLGAPKDNFNAILRQFSTIARAKAAIRPIWMRSFPDDAMKIKVDIVTEMPN